MFAGLRVMAMAVRPAGAGPRAQARALAGRSHKSRGRMRPWMVLHGGPPGEPGCPHRSIDSGPGARPNQALYPC
jgi:hypothetical protein